MLTEERSTEFSPIFAEPYGLADVYTQFQRDLAVDLQIPTHRLFGVGQPETAAMQIYCSQIEDMMKRICAPLHALEARLKVWESHSRMLRYRRMKSIRRPKFACVVGGV